MRTRPPTNTRVPGTLIIGRVYLKTAVTCPTFVVKTRNPPEPEKSSRHPVTALSKTET